MILLLTAAALAVCLVLLFRQRSRIRTEKERVRLVRRGDMYAHLYPILERCARREIENVSVSPTEVEIRLLSLTPRTLRYTFTRQGFDPLSPEMTLALAQAVGNDIPVLRNRERYTFDMKETELANGDKFVYYVYGMKIAWKDTVMRGMIRKSREEL